MQVTKRNGELEEVSFDKVLTRIRKAADGLEVDPVLIAQRVITRIYQAVRTSELDELTANLAISLATTNPDYGSLAARIAISNHQKNTASTWRETVEILASQPKNNLAQPYVSFVQRWAGILEKDIDYSRDFLLDYFGFKTLELQHYLMRDTHGRVIERPQHLWMRVAASLWLDKIPADATESHPLIEQIRLTYNLLSTKQYIHATPTNFNSGTNRPQLSSCFLLSMKDDSISGIYDTLKDCAQISKYAGGIGLHIHNIRAKGSHIAGTNGTSNGIVPMLRNFNMTARYVDQCWGPGTKIIVRNKSVSNEYKSVPIELIRPGDEVLTSGGCEDVTEAGKFFYPPSDMEPKFHPVAKVVTHNYSGPIYRIKTYPMTNGGDSSKITTAYVTSEHPILSAHNSSSDILCRTIDSISLDYRPVRELRTGDFVLYPNTSGKSIGNFDNTKRWIFNRVLEIAEHQIYSGPLYDLEVDGPTHDYTVEGIGIAHNGGGKRNGSFAIYLEPWHADIEDFLKLKTPQGAEEERARDLFYALWISDLFMERVEADAEWSLFCPHEAPGLADCHSQAFRDLYERYERQGLAKRKVSAQKLWFKILDSQIETGTPYILYKDAANAKSNQQNLGTIKSSNLCVAPETMILTDKGYYSIKELSGKKVNVWNGDKWSETTITKTGENQKLIKVMLSNGSEIECTPYHKFIISPSYTDKCTLKNATRIEAKDLKEGMYLTKFKLDIVKGSESNDILYPYTHGFFCGDGTISGQTKTLSLYGEKKKLIPHLQIHTVIEDAVGRLDAVLPSELADKYFVPINSSIHCRLEWLAGILDSDGSVANNDDNQSLQIGSINKKFLLDIQYMLQTLGIFSKVTQAFDEQKTMLPDEKGNIKEYNCKSLWRLIISSSSVYKLLELGLKTHRLIIENQGAQQNEERIIRPLNIENGSAAATRETSINEIQANSANSVSRLVPVLDVRGSKVLSVKDMGRMDDTYCFNEPENHAGVFNGILTGNCTEIIEYSSPEETAVCNLASLSLPAFVKGNGVTKGFDFNRLRTVVATTVTNLNRVIDINYYPTEECRRSNMRHRPIGLGVQGLADVFAQMRMPWESEKAAILNQRIAEHIYYAAVEQSITLASQEGTYETYEGSPASKGQLQPDLWGIEPITEKDGSLDWATLRQKLAQYGLRNSLLIAPMPTASTSQILGNTECFEPVLSNIFTRRTLSGEYIIVNKNLMADLRRYGVWSEALKQKIIAQNGSVQGLEEIPDAIQKLYKTAWEIKQRTLIDMAADRGAFICQSQSLNLFVADPTYAKLTSMHFYGWRKGLKTGIYYLRTRAPVMAQKFTVDPEVLAEAQRADEERQRKAGEPDEGCLVCSA